MDELSLRSTDFLPLEMDVAALVAGGESSTRATELATERAVARASDARIVVLVEGISDAIAIEVIASRCGQTFSGADAAVVPMGGVTNLGRFVSRFSGVVFAGLYDSGAEGHVQRVLDSGTRGGLRTSSLEDLGFYACVEDLEDEFIRSLGTAAVERVIEREGQLKSFRTMQREPHYRDRSKAVQLRRFVGRWRYRYARLLAEAVDVGCAPTPVLRLLDHVTG